MANGVEKREAAVVSTAGGHQSSSYIDFSFCVKLSVIALSTSRVKPRYSKSSAQGSPKQRSHFLLLPTIFLFSPCKALTMYLRKFMSTSLVNGIAWPSNLSGLIAISFSALALIRLLSVKSSTQSFFKRGDPMRIVSFAEHWGEVH